MKLQIKSLVFFFSLLISTFSFAQKKVASPTETVSGKINGATITNTEVHL
jgi:hypothetical protein